VTVIRTRAIPSFAAGVRAAASRPRLVVALWAWQLLLATAAAFPLHRALVAATSESPATDRLLEGFSVSAFTELLHYTSLPVGQMVQMGAIGAALVSVLLSPALLAMVVAAVEAPSRPARSELAAAAGTWYWPFLRLVVFGRLAGVLVAGLVAGGMLAALRPVRESLWEIGRLASGPVTLLAALVPVALFFAAVDYAMVHAMRTGSRRMFAAWRMGLRASLGRPVATLGLWMLAALVLVGLAALLVAVFGVVSGSSRLAIALTFVVLQLFVVFRIGLRVALVGGEAAAWRVVPDAVAPPVEAPAPEPPPAPPVDPLPDAASL
jgi:hypothetical protein